MRILSFSWRCGWWLGLAAALAGLGAATGCSKKATTAPAAQPARMTKTLFTEKLGVFLVYATLKAGQSSEFDLHLTNLAEGTPVERAEITFKLRAKSDQATTTVKAAASATAGIYTAPVTFPKSGEYYVECELKHETFSGRLTLTDFDVE